MARCRWTERHDFTAQDLLLEGLERPLTRLGDGGGAGGHRLNEPITGRLTVAATRLL